MILLGAAISDLFRRRVYNLWLVPGALAGLALRGPAFFRSSLLMFFPVYLLFRLRLMGAGDGKVLMLIAGSLGLYESIPAVFTGFCLAALYSGIRIFREKSLGERLRRLALMAGELIRTGKVTESEKMSLCSSKNSIPLAACLSAGSIIFILLKALNLFEGGQII